MSTFKAKELSKLGYTNDQARSLVINIISRHFKHHSKQDLTTLLIDIKAHPEVYLKDEILHKIARTFLDVEDDRLFNVFSLLPENKTGPLKIVGGKEIEAYTEQLKVYWQVGAYVYHRLQSATWGEQVVNQLADWLKKKEPALKQFDRRSLYRMREFYLTWYALDWEALRKDGSVISGIESVDNQDNKFVVSLTPQFIDFPNILSSLSWTHHVDLLSRTKNLEEKVFYLMLGAKEKYTVRELKRQIDSGLYERQKATRHQIAGNRHPNAEIIPQIFKDKYIFEFLDLPDPYSENDLQKGLVKYLKQFILEIGRDFTFMGEEYRLQIGKQDFYIDLLFYHRELQCLVVFELKATAFQPEFLGKLNFYLEALDREVKKPHENPSIGVLLCTENDKEIVEIALSRNISPALVAEYETKLIDKDLLRRMLREWTENIKITPPANSLLDSSSPLS